MRESLNACPSLWHVVKQPLSQSLGMMASEETQLEQHRGSQQGLRSTPGDRMLQPLKPLQCALAG